MKVVFHEHDRRSLHSWFVWLGLKLTGSTAKYTHVSLQIGTTVFSLCDEGLMSYHHDALGTQAVEIIDIGIWSYDSVREWHAIYRLARRRTKISMWDLITAGLYQLGLTSLPGYVCTTFICECLNERLSLVPDVMFTQLKIYEEN